MDYTVGDLAKRTGLTVRTLHHYEQLGLLMPASRSDGGYRRYTDEDVRTLHRLLAYRQMGLPLKDIAPLLAPGAQVPLAELLAKQIAAVEREIAEQQRLLTMLRRVERRALDGAEDTEDLLRLITAQQVFARHYSGEDLDRLRALQDGLAPELLAHLKVEIPALIADFRSAHDAARPVDAQALGPLVRRWLAVEDLVPVDEDLRRKGRRMIGEDADFQQMSGIDAALARYIDAAILAHQPASPDAEGAPA
ncbi:MerR family transcriptional regulator [Roseateles sp. So40a]|uniref:MerR family transcriptional regulator n=1 Tax=Roseateles sp. So40a TaxID=3400226 RepID=UPI003A8B4CBB